MNYYIQQSIHIHFIKIGAVSNSSVFQIGSSGIIKPASYLNNSGGFTGPAPQAKKPGTQIITSAENQNGGQFPLSDAPAVPF